MEQGNQGSIIQAINSVAEALEGNQQVDWARATYQNGWVDYSTGFHGGRYCRDRQGYVHLSGLIKNGTVSTGSTGYAFMLPEGFRPSVSLIFVCVSNAALGQIRVHNDGGVQMHAGSNAWFSLEGIIFQAEQ